VYETVRHYPLYLFVFFLLSGIIASAQDVDSLKVLVESQAEDTTKVNTLNAIASAVYRSEPDEALKYSEESRILAEEIDFSKGLALAHKNLGLGYYMQGNYAEAFRCWEPSLQIYEELGDYKMVANLLSNMGSIYYSIGKNVEAIEYFLRSLKMAEELLDSTRISTLFLNIGVVYSEMPATYDTARNYYLRAIEMGETIGEMNVVGVGTINLGEIYVEKEEYDSALFYFEKALTIVTSSIDSASILNFMGSIHAQREEYQIALAFHENALEMARKENAQREMVGILLGLAATHESLDNPTLAIRYYREAESVAGKIGLNQELSGAYEGLATNYAEIRDYSNAYKYLSLQNTIDNTIYRIESDNKTNNLIFSYQMEKKQDEIAILEKESLIDHLKSRRQRAIIISTGLFGLLLLAMAIGLFNRMRFIRDTNKKINTQNELITDSIRYAQRIQTAVLPSQALLEAVMPEHFVLLKPKDIVSGDFYWVKEVQDHLVIVGADCTGHGVPGAFMSMLGVTILNDLIGDRCFSAPSAILEQLRIKVKEILAQDGDKDEQKDGMDLALAIYNKTTRELHFAGANNPLYVIRNKELPVEKDMESYASTSNDEYQLFELKGDKQPIGVHWEETSFTTRSVMLREEDAFYIFSDGFVDQFGGEYRKKYKSLNFKKLLLSIQKESMNKQKQTLETTFESWMGNYEQIDDVSVVGVRI